MPRCIVVVGALVVLLAGGRALQAGDGSLHLSGFAEAGLVREPGIADGRTRSEGRGGFVWEVPRLALAVDRRWEDGGAVHVVLESPSGPGGPDGELRVSEAWMFRPHEAGIVAVRAGAMPVPFSREHKGPLRTTVHTITPSVLNTFYESIRFRGLVFTKYPEPHGDNFQVHYGVGSGTDDVTVLDRTFRLDDGPGVLPVREADGRFSYFGYMGKNHSDSCRQGRIGWHVGYFGGNGDEAAGVVDKTEFALWDLSFERNRMGIFFQLAEGSSELVDRQEDFEAGFVMGTWATRRAGGLAARVDRWDRHRWGGGPVDTGRAFTLAWTPPWRRPGRLQLEWIHPVPRHDGTPAGQDLVQARLRVPF